MAQADQVERGGPLAREGQQVAPRFGGEAFHCSLCGVLAVQHWNVLAVVGPGGTKRDSEYWRCRCSNCKGSTCWREEPTGGRMVDPVHPMGPRSHVDMPSEVKQDYEEARSIVALSPRGACALERLAVQKLVDDLEEGRGDLDAKIGRMVAKGLPEEIQQMLDILRVIGNNAVHPGELDLKDDVETAVALMDCMNMIVEERVARRGRIRQLYEKLPQGAREAIERRDNPNAD